MDQVVDLDSPTIWARVIAERGALFKRVMPMAMENLSITQHRCCVPYHLPNLDLIIITSTWIPPFDYSCQVCQKIDDANQMLLCDNCNGGYHLFCLKPKLIQVPVGIWYCSSCSHVAPWFLLRPCHTFLDSSLGGDTWEFHFDLLLCIVYICACISFWLISFYLWLVLGFLFSRVYYGFTSLQHWMS
jgi:hypothetical protein